ncbi:nuclear transport factor 2 family protein [Flavisphingomonas formosensis]|uniref:nuclear transport factor 2 family protein n=1 Tax=Flavisphingomonas formosensis TaxID=861534 RepID=UPI0012F9E79F|nr:nuclear transport factor 2 family protein [Sphingomonas formosensis]
MTNASPASEAGRAMTTIDALAARLAALEDERAVRALIERYGHLIDYGRDAEWVAAFTSDGAYELIFRCGVPPAMAEAFPHAILAADRFRVEGAEALAGFIATHTYAPNAWHKHVVVDPQITIDGDDATAESYFLRIDLIEGRREILSFGRYRDRIVRGADGIWRFAERVMEVESAPGDPA